MLVGKTKDDNYVFLMDWDADKILSFTDICFRGAFCENLDCDGNVDHDDETAKSIQNSAL